MFFRQIEPVEADSHTGKKGGQVEVDAREGGKTERNTEQGESFHGVILVQERESAMGKMEGFCKATSWQFKLKLVTVQLIVFSKASLVSGMLFCLPKACLASLRLGVPEETSRKDGVHAKTLWR